MMFPTRDGIQILRYGFENINLVVDSKDSDLKMFFFF